MEVALDISKCAVRDMDVNIRRWDGIHHDGRLDRVIVPSRATVTVLSPLDRLYLYDRLLMGWLVRVTVPQLIMHNSTYNQGSRCWRVITNHQPSSSFTKLYSYCHYYYDRMFIDLEIFDQKKSKRNPKIQKKNILSEGCVTEHPVVIVQ